MKRHNTIIVTFISIMCFAACSKSEDQVPGNGQDAYVNFCNASEVQQQNVLLAQQNRVIINDTSWDNLQPEFMSDGDIRQYPRHLTGTDLAVDRISGDIYWMAVIADSYKLTYTSINQTPLHDTTISVTPKSFTTQYLVESPATDNAYCIFTVPVERKGIAGKVRVQVMNLSPDFGPLEVYRTAQDGSRIPTALPSAIAYGTYSPYVELDTAGAAGTNGKLMLKFCKSGSDDVITTRAVDAVSNSSYTIVFQGFETETPRRIRTGEHEYQQVTVSPNLRVNMRRIF